MQAIMTKYIKPTDTKGSRYKAQCERGSIIVSYDYSKNAIENHKLAAKTLCEKFAKEDLRKYGTPVNKNPWLKPLIMGEYNGKFYHVFVE